MLRRTISPPFFMARLVVGIFALLVYIEALSGR